MSEKGTYGKLLRINKICNINNVFFYVKMAIIQAPIEAALTLFCFETYLIYTTPDTMLTSKQLIFSVFYPIIGAIFACIIYTVIILLIYFTNIIKCYDLYIKDIDKKYINYLSINNYFKIVFLKIHFLGLCFYTITSLIIGLSFNTIKLQLNLPYNISPIYIILFGIIFGLIWNISGVFGDGRINWTMIYTELNTIELTDDVKKIKYKSYYKYWYIQILIIIFVFVFFLFTLFTISPLYLKEKVDINNGEILSFTFFIISCIFVIINYVKIIYNLHLKYEFEDIPNDQSFYVKFKNLIVNSKNIDTK